MKFTDLKNLGNKYGYEFAENAPLYVFTKHVGQDVRRIRLLPGFDHTTVEYLVMDERRQSKVHVAGSIPRLAEQRENDRRLEEVLRDPENYRWDRYYKPINRSKPTP